jgi:hypothetical protein
MRSYHHALRIASTRDRGGSDSRLLRHPSDGVVPAATSEELSISTALCRHLGTAGSSIDLLPICVGLLPPVKTPSNFSEKIRRTRSFAGPSRRRRPPLNNPEQPARLNARYCSILCTPDAQPTRHKPQDQPTPPNPTWCLRRAWGGGSALVDQSAEIQR